MRHERFYTFIGLFVVGGLILIFLGSLFFYKQYTQSKVQTFVMFFKGSLKGLSTNAPVTYRGVKIGQVSLIELTENKIKHKVEIPVYVEFSVEKNLTFDQNPIELLIKNGFVANITSPNLLTGVSNIELVKNKVKPIYYLPQYFRGYPIFPTRNGKEKVTTFDETLKSARIMIEEITKLVRSPLIKDTLSSTRNMATSFNRVTDNLDDYLPPAINYFNRSMKEIANAANSFENLSDYLARHPESLLRGKS